MKIIVSPSKTMNFTSKIRTSNQNPLFSNKTNELLNELQRMDKEELATVLKIKGKLLDKIYEYYSNFGTNSSASGPAILSYTGEVFKQLNLSGYCTEDFIYLQDHLYILSALYGALRSFDIIEAYRLDMTKSIINVSLYNHWCETLTDFISDDVIVNLASTEYSKLIRRPMINIHFLEHNDGSYKNVAIYSKKARGMMLDYMIKNKIQNSKQIETFSNSNYTFDKAISSTNDMYFIRNQK